MARLERHNKEHEMTNVIADLLTGKPVEEVPSNVVADLLCNIDDKLRSLRHVIKKAEDSSRASNPVELTNQAQAGTSDPFLDHAGSSNQSQYQP